MKNMMIKLLALAMAIYAGNAEKVDMGTVIGIDLGTTYSW